jgi:hypothetical protein
MPFLGMAIVQVTANDLTSTHFYKFHSLLKKADLKIVKEDYLKFGITWKGKILTIIFWELHSFLHQPCCKIQVFFSKIVREVLYATFKIIRKGLRGYRICFTLGFFTNSVFRLIIAKS